MQSVLVAFKQAVENVTDCFFTLIRFQGILHSGPGGEVGIGVDENKALIVSDDSRTDDARSCSVVLVVTIFPGATFSCTLSWLRLRATPERGLDARVGQRVVSPTCAIKKRSRELKI